MLCKCGHEQDAHYTYILNGHPQTRCRACDPWVKAGIKGGGNFTIQAGSRFEQQDRAADHEFVPSMASQN